MKKIFYKLYKFLFPKRIELQRMVKLGISMFLEDHELRTWMIHSITAKLKQGRVIVTITLGRPGLLIGKGGQTIDSLTNYLQNFCVDKPVTIKIREYDIFREPSYRGR